MSNYQRLGEPLVDQGYPQQPQQPQQPYAAAPYPPHQPLYPQNYAQPAPQQYVDPAYAPQQPPLYAQPGPLAVYPPQLSVAGSPGHLAHGRWSDGLFDCFDSGTICLLACFLPFLRWSTTVSRLRYLSMPAALLLSTPPFVLYTAMYVFLNVRYPGTYGTDAVGSYGALYYIMFALMMAGHIAFVAIGTYYRGKLRREYAIDGGVLGDCCWHYWCSCCAIAQEARHVDRDFGFPV